MDEVPDPKANAIASGVLPVLDQELNRLPDKYRGLLVLCGLEGKSREEAARQFGIPEGTVSSRLSRGRQLLADRLARRGFVLTVGSLAAVLSPEAASASVPASLVANIVKAAAFSGAGEAAAAGLISTPVAALTEGVLQNMYLAKIKIAATVLMALATLRWHEPARAPSAGRPGGPTA